ncbi:MAG TPA: hypothetical protein VKJ65_14275, partial [Phycisphaerae bacterium]|nr:hypothetical protein [Phycisphaerae bacterium]
MGITEGLDVHGNAAVIIPKLMPGNGEPVNRIILFPTTDPEKVLSAMNPASVQNGISSVQPHNTMPGFAAVTGHYVAFSIDQQTLADFLASKQSLSDALSASDVNMIDAGDVGLYINVASIREPAEKAMDTNFANSMQMFQAMGGAQNQKMIDQAQFGLAIDKMIIHEVLDDVKTGVATITISDDGISIDMDHQFESGTPLADFVTDSKPLGDKPFAGLPDISPTMAVSINMSGGWLSELLKKWSDGLANDPNLKSNVQAQQTAQQWNQASQVYKLLHSQATVISLSPTVKGFSLTTVDDPDQVLDLQRQIAQESVNTLALQNNSMTGFNMSGQFTQNDLTVDNVSFDKFVFNITPSAQASSNPGSVMATQFLQNLLGPDGVTAYTGVQGNSLVSGINTSNDELQSAVEAAKNSTDAIDSDSSIVAAQQHVLPDASIVAYGQPSAIFEVLLNVFR